MNIYIGYKYRNFKEKEALKQTLSELSEVISSLGHKTFILGRDKFNWNHHSSPSKSIVPIIKNIRKNDVFFAVVECDSKSDGLLFESLCSRVFGKKMILAVKKGLVGKPFNKFTKNIIEFENYEDLSNTIRTNLNKYL